jgi:phosphoribosylanthranilate isomerase
MTWVKVCGLSSEADVDAAVEAGADAVGFVVAEGSPRQVSVDRAAGLIGGVPILTVLVTRDVTSERLTELVEATGAGGVQPHGRHAAHASSTAAIAGRFVLRPIAMGGGTPEPDPTTVPEPQVPLLDSAADTAIGGTGARFDWAKIPALDRRFVLAGGLDPENVAEAIAAVRPWGVDASSGLELRRGVKDRGRVVAFIEEAKRA